MTKGDKYFIEICTKLLKEGCPDKNPRPHWADGTPAHTLSLNHFLCSYDLSKGESPFITLRPIATKSAFGELLWIYQDQTNDLQVLEDKYNVKWWDEWALRDKSLVSEDNPEGYVLNEAGHRNIGACYGEEIAKYDQVNKLIEGLKKDPDGRRHSTNMWQFESFERPHGLKPCAYQTQWNVRHGLDGVDYLDMCLYQRSSDFGTAGCINQVQYCAFLVAIAKVLNYVPGQFSWMVDNVQIYDRHVKNITEMLLRKPLDINPKIVIEREVEGFYDIKVEDFIITDYPIDMVKEKNPQLRFEVAI